LLLEPDGTRIRFVADALEQQQIEIDLDLLKSEIQ
jgi:hypothetical protein